MEDNMIDVTPTDKKIEKIKSQSEDIKKDVKYMEAALDQMHKDLLEKEKFKNG